jgi:hypothetical protein
VLAAPGERPSFLGADLRALLEPHPAPVLSDGWHVCGGAAAQVSDGGLRLDGSGIDVVRAACAAAWAAVDSGQALDPGTVPELQA